MSDTVLAPDGLFLMHDDSQTFDLGGNKNKVVVPHNVAPRLLYHMHNQVMGQHPSMSQLKARFCRTFYTWNLQPLLDALYKGCYTSAPCYE